LPRRIYHQDYKLDSSIRENQSYLFKRMFGKYKIALANPRRSPLAPLKKGGTGLLVPLLKGDLAVSYGRGSPAHKSATRQGDLRISKHPLRWFGGSKIYAATQTDSLINIAEDTNCNLPNKKTP
jgi:hypothetical protein